MTNAQKWVSAFLGLFLILFFLGRLTVKEETSAPPISGGQIANQQAQVSDDADGPALVKQLGCISCHGGNLQGTNIGPALVNIKEHWTRDAVINYLRNPSSYSGDARFQQYREQFKNIIMPAFNNIDVKQLGKIADYLMTR